MFLTKLLATLAHLYSLEIRLAGWLKHCNLSLVDWLKTQKPLLLLQKLLLPLLFTAAAQEALVKVKVEVHTAVGADPSRTECACLLIHFFRQASQVQGNKKAKHSHSR